MADGRHEIRWVVIDDEPHFALSEIQALLAAANSQELSCAEIAFRLNEAVRSPVLVEGSDNDGWVI